MSLQITINFIIFQFISVAVESLVKDTRAQLLEAELQKAEDTIQTLKRELEEAKSVPLKENRMDKMRQIIKNIINLLCLLLKWNTIFKLHCTQLLI